MENIADLHELNYKEIGPWSIGCTTIMYCLHHEDQLYKGVLFDDLIIRRGLRTLYGDDLTIKRAEEIAETWIQYLPDGIIKDWRASVIWYLWKEFT